MAIANALQLEAARATPVLFRFNYDAMPIVRRRWTYPLPYYSVFAADTVHYFSLWPWPLTLNICSVSPIAISVWPYDLERVLHVALASGILFSPSLTFDNLSVPQLLRILMPIGCHAVTWVIDDLAWFRRGISVGGALLPSGSRGCVDPNSPNLAEA